MHIPTPNYIKQILTTFNENGFQIYVVGGAVRDIYLNRVATDWDFTTDATPQQIIELFPNTFYDNSFGTVGITNPEDEQLHSEGKLQRIPVYEVTTFRTEQGYSDNRRPDQVIWGTDLIEDLKRRDFTISAMALKPHFNNNDITEYEIIDPYHGESDLQNKLVKAVGDPHERFAEDALRMMRAIRIAAQLGFSIDLSTLQALQDQAHTIQQIAFERIQVELYKILASDHAADAVTLLYTSGLLQYLIPELIKSRNVEQSGHHTDDVWTHSINSLRHCPSHKPIVKLATLVHDIGKPYTRAYVCTHCHKYFRHNDHFPEDESPSNIECPNCHQTNAYRQSVVFHNHEMAGAHIVESIAKRLKLSNHDKNKLITLVRWHMFSVDERQTDKAIRRFIRNVGKENLDDILDLRIGDRLGGGARETSWRLERFKELLIEVQKEPFTIHDLKISGHEVMQIGNLEPGPQIGQILKKLFQEVEDKTLSNTSEALQTRLKEIID